MKKLNVFNHHNPPSSILDPRSSILHHPHPHPHRSNFRQSIMTIDVLSVIYERYEENA